jgi:hypothetical protein
MYSGPHIERDGLVFGYDTGQFASTNPNFEKFKPGGVKSKRFFKGKPSINYAAHKNAVPQSSYTSYAATTSGTWVAKHPGSIRAYNAQGTDISNSSNSGVGDWTNTYHAYWTYDKTLKKPVIQMNAFDSNWKAKSFGVGMPAWSSLGVSAGDKYVISWLQWTTNTNLRADVGFYSKNTSNGNGFHDGRQSPRNTKTNKWERVYAVYTVSSNRNLDNSYGSIFMYGHTTSNGAGKILKIADVQLEILTDHPSDYLDSKSTGITTSRSSTESLIDLTRTTNIDVSNVSFDSNGLPTFDGTDDRISIPAGSFPTIGVNDFTVEVICKNTKTSSYNHFFSVKDQSHFALKMENAGNRRAYVYRTSGTSTYSAAPTYLTSTSNYYHLLVKREGDNLEMFLNGVSTGTKSGWNNLSIDNNTHTSYIGWGWASEYTGGDIPIVKIYNRALTAQEIKQNFRAYKNRFDI